MVGAQVVTDSFKADLTGRVSQLFVHPVKSCAGVEVREALLTETGLDLDRAWMVVDAQGQFLSQRELPRMALVRPQIRSTEIVLRAPGMLALHLDIDRVEAPATVSVWGDVVPAWDMGAVAAQWFTDFLGQACRLVRFDPEHQRLSSLDWTGGVHAPNQFSDGFPLLVASDSSLALLNEHLARAGEPAVGMERFRPNVVVSGLQAHDEDRTDALDIQAEGGAVRLRLVKPCARCPIPDVDPATGVVHPSVSTALRGYRQDRRLNGAITFGMNAIIERGVGQVLRVGQRVVGQLQFD